MTEEQQEQEPEVAPEIQAQRHENDELLERITAVMSIAFRERMEGKRGFIILGGPVYGMAVSVISSEEPGSYEQIAESCQLLSVALRTMAHGCEEGRREELLALIHQVLNGTRPTDG